MIFPMCRRVAQLGGGMGDGEQQDGALKGLSFGAQRCGLSVVACGVVMVRVTVLEVGLPGGR